MGRKKRGAKKTTKSLKERATLAWKNLLLFLIIFIISFILYTFSSNDLLKNFFGVLAIIFGFLTFALLISFIVLAILKTDRK